MPKKISHEKYSKMFGPTTGDQVRLADTDLFIEVEKDYTSYGEEAIFGGGKTVRDGMAQTSSYSRDDGLLDTVITNALILDYTGIYKADIGIRSGKIVGIGKAGNPDTQYGVDEDMIIGTSTEVISGENKIVTAGGVDTHVHYVTPEIVEVALEGGITTIFGGGTGPADGTNATTVTPGPWHIREMIRSFENMPINVGILGKGNTSDELAIVEQIKAGAAGLKVHEDWGATPAVIDHCLTIADKYDVQVALHSDTLNEAGNVEDTIEAINGRTLHSFHTEGAGGGHAPDIIKMAGMANILPASTNPTLPFTKNTVDEHLDMVMTAHNLDANIEEDVAFADSRIRPESIGAEDVLHDMGIFSITSSDALAMGRIGETVTRTWQVAHKNKVQFGPLEEDMDQDNDNYRAKRYIAKYTINPAIAQGIDSYIGSIETNKYADLVIWEPAMFGVRPEMILKSGSIVHANVGDPNASIPTPQPRMYRSQFGAKGEAPARNSIIFVSQSAIEEDIETQYELTKKLLPVKNTRNISKKDMKLNDVEAPIEVDPDTYKVTIQGKLIYSKPLDVVPMTQLYNLF